MVPQEVVPQGPGRVSRVSIAFECPTIMGKVTELTDSGTIFILIGTYTISVGWNGLSRNITHVQSYDWSKITMDHIMGFDWPTGGGTCDGGMLLGHSRRRAT